MAEPESSTTVGAIDASLLRKVYIHMFCFVGFYIRFSVLRIFSQLFHRIISI